MATTREDRLFIALQKCAGALEAMVKSQIVRPSAIVTFTGDYADLGSMSVSQIIDEANEALEEQTE